jgi:anti-anti-sigma factor
VSEQPVIIDIRQDKEICTVRISGRLATGAHDELLQARAREIKGLGCGNLLLDIRDLRSVGSSGIGFFVDLYASMRTNGGNLVLAGPSPHVQRVLALTRVSTIIPTVADLAAAMAFLTPRARNAAGAS